MRLFILAVTVAVSLAGDAVAQRTWPDARSAVSFADYRVFDAAIGGLEGSGHERPSGLDGYELVLVERVDTYVVYFTDPSGQHLSMRGSSPYMQEFEVHLRKHDLSFVRWVGWR